MMAIPAGRNNPMILKLTLLFFLAPLSTGSYARQLFSIQGVVKTEKGIPIESATVFLEEVSIGNNSRRTSHLELFFFTFVGRSENAASCKILNPEVIEFSTNGDLLRAMSKDFTIIENRNLGYRIKYLIRDFRYNIKTQLTIYDGSCIFENLPGGLRQKKKWDKNRLLTYRGSFMHFLRSLYAGNTESEGFLSDQMSAVKTDTTSFVAIESYVSRTVSNFISLPE